jgi:SagB-type dehydrogenase family enzyme
VAFWREGRLILVNFATGVQAYGTPLIVEILSFFQTWRSAADLHRAMPNAPSPMLASIVDLLIARTLLVVKGAAPPEERAMDAWHAWNPSAGFFHHSTRDVPFSDQDAKDRLLGRALRRKRHKLVKKLPGSASIKLPSAATAPREFTEVLLARRTWREFAAGPISLDDLSTLLRLTGGVQRWEQTVEGPAVLKTSPSGGATHPSELYVFALDVAGLKRGLYHYRADTNALEVIRYGGRRADVEKYLPTQWWYRHAAALVFFSAIFSRSQWRYNYARAYRALLVEAGHMCQTFCLTATALRLAPFSVMALADSAIERDLGLDGRTESVLYCAGVGHRPPGRDWAPSPPEALRPRSRVPISRRATTNRREP